MDGGVGNLKARFNNVYFSRNLNQNMPYITLFKKSKYLEALGAPSPDPRVVTHIYCLCNKTFKVRNSNVSTFILFKVHGWRRGHNLRGQGL